MLSFCTLFTPDLENGATKLRLFAAMYCQMADIDLQLPASTYWQMVIINLLFIYSFSSANGCCQFEVLRSNVLANGCYQFALYSLMLANGATKLQFSAAMG